MSIMINGHPMPLRAVLVFPDGRREDVEGVILEQGDSFQEACVRQARERGATVEFLDSVGIASHSTRPS
jgi:hypothetical protein